MTQLYDPLPPTLSTTADAERLCRLLDAVLSLHSDLDHRGLLRRIVHHAVGLVDARDGALGVLDETGLRVALLVTPEELTYVSTGRQPPNQWFLGLLIKEPRPHRFPDARRTPRSAPSSSGSSPSGSFFSDPPRTFLGVPIWARGMVFGHLYLTDKRNAEPFTDTDESLMVSLATAAGLAVENVARHARSIRREAALREV